MSYVTFHIYINCRVEDLLLMQSFCDIQPGLRSIWEKYYEEAHAVVYVIDAASPSRFEDSKSALGTRSYLAVQCIGTC